MPRRAGFVSLVLVWFALAAAASPLPAPGGAPPFSTIGRVGAQDTGVRVTVTRRIGTAEVRLPAALVPKLQPGDVVEAHFADFSAPNTRVRYHVNVAFINESATIDWLYARSSPQDRLFASRKAPANGGVSFTYGTKNRSGTPIFFIVPEDEKTRGMDGVREYVGAHPTDFKTMASSANETVDRYDWFHDFLGAVGSGSIDVMAGRARIVAAATGLGADPNALNACYAEYTAAADIQNCVESQLDGLTQQTNFSAPTEAQFFGGLVGSATPLRLASYLTPLLTVWKIFAGSGRQEYEYLPVTLAPADPGRGAASDVQLLAGEKVPTLRPPAAYSSVLFFTIGEPAAPSPRIVNDTPAGGMCARTERVMLPLHVDRTSRYLHDTALEIAGGGPVRRLPVSPGSADAPILDRAAVDDGGAAGYRVRLSGRFGFDPLPTGVQPVAYVAVPSRAPWTVAVDPHRTLEAGGTFDAVAASPSAPCLSRAELQVGGSPPVPLTVTAVDATHVALHAALAGVPPGDATLRFYEEDAARSVSVETDASVTIAAPVAVTAKPVPQAALGDTAIALDGTGLERAATLRAGSQTYVKTPDSSATRACFAGPALDGAVAGQLLPAEIFEAGAAPGPAFALSVLPRRPQLGAADLAPAATIHFSNARLRLTLTGKNVALPENARVLLRRAPATAGPCPAAAATSAAVDEGDVRPLGSGGLEADIAPADVLGNDAFGTLQAAVADTQTGLSSEWISLPGTFVRAPTIVRVACPAGTGPCLLVGTHLESIAAVHTSNGDIAPDFNCTSPDPKQQCAAVPRQDRYAFVLRDGNTPYIPIPPPAVQSPG